MKDILKFIPGFRTQAKWKMVVASIYYLLSLFMFTGGIGMFLFCIAIPFVVFSIVDLVKKKGARRNPAIALAVSFILFCSGANLVAKTVPTSDTKNNKVAANIQSNKNTKPKKVSKIKAKAVTTISGNLKIHYINVGQGDSELIQNNGENMLIDTGTNESTNSLVSYLKSQNVSKITYLILTHPHEDHIGGADVVIKQFNVQKVYMPKATTNTKTFKDVILAMKDKGLKATVPTVGEEFKIGTAACKILSPINVNKEDLNTYSIVIKLTYGSTKFMFTGDAQSSNEIDMINKNFDLNADVLKVGHHGSKTSTVQAFLDKVNPKYAVISCGKNNDYGHPHTETMKELQAKNIKVYRTDENGTIVCTSDGKSITFNCNHGDYNPGAKKENATNSSTSIPEKKEAPTTSVPAASSSQSTQQSSQPASQPVQQPAQNQNQSETVYVTNTGKKYHRDGCRSLRKSKIPMSLKDAQAQGYTPCEICNP